MRREAVLWAGRCVGLGVAAGVPSALAAQEVQTGVLLSTGLSAETNPYNEVGGKDLSVAATAEIRPQLELRNATTSIDVDSYARFRQFFATYGLEDSYGANGRLETRASERLTMRANAFVAYNDGAYGGYGRPGLSPAAASAPVTSGGETTPPPTLPEPVLETPVSTLTDATILGQRTRTTNYGSGVGFDARLSALTSVAANLDTRVLRFGTPGYSDYSSATAEARVSRTISDLTSVGVIGSVGHTNYFGTRVGDSLIYSALASLDRRFSSRWAVSLAAGASIARIRQPLGLPDAHLTSVNVRGQFCWQDPIKQLCVNAQRSPQPSATGNVRVNDSIGVNYSQRLSTRERLTLGGSYSHTGEGRGVATNLPAISFVSASARYDNQLAERMTFYTSASISKIYGGLFSRRANIGVAAGLQYRLGALR